jgi:hypothetical protein
VKTSKKDVSAVRAVLGRYVIAVYHRNAAELCSVVTPKVRTSLISLASLSGKKIKSCTAAATVFFKGSKQTVTLKQAKQEVAGATIVVHKNTAQATVHGEPKPILFVREHGHWLISSFA